MSIIKFPVERAQYKGATRDYPKRAPVVRLEEVWCVDGVMHDGSINHGFVKAINQAQAEVRAALAYAWYDTAFIVSVIERRFTK